ncbi:ABC transporter ATP-binding protein [Glycocaulis sp.]|uniref:ABC transporter ATP-binding protein n=1 Tax=Glycocaulis sp. TaxID=1969725 RepID=UPI003D1E2107
MSQLTASAPPSLGVNGLRISAGDNVLVPGLSLTIGRGEILGMVGASGSGKTISAFSLARLLPETLTQSGEISLEGERIDLLSEAQMRKVRGGRIGMVFQDPLSSFNPLRTVGSILVESICRHQGLPASQARELAIETLATMRLPGRNASVDAYPHMLSGGQRQRAMIGLALVNQPALIIADEPTTALDPTIQLQILALLRHQASSAACLFITHDIGAASAICDRLAVMNAGVIVEEGPTDQLLSSPTHPFTRELLSHAPGGARFR